MGTRHYQVVIDKKGTKRVQQYGQWDGYPKGQGKDILAYLRSGNLDKYQDELDKINLISEEQSKDVETDENWERNYPYMSRNCGSDIHQMIENGDVKFVDHIDEAEAKKWCEGFYTIDFQKGLFITEYYDHKVEIKLSELPTEEEYVQMFFDDDED